MIIANSFTESPKKLQLFRAFKLYDKSIKRFSCKIFGL